MKKRKIIAVMGRQGVGKSTTIRLAYNRIMTDPKVSYSEFRVVGRKDFVAVVVRARLCIWFISQGDTIEHVKKHRKFLAKRYAHDVIICAIRSKGATKAYIEGHKPDYDVRWETLKVRGTTAQQKRHAKRILDLM